MGRLMRCLAVLSLVVAAGCGGGGGGSNNGAGTQTRNVRINPTALVTVKQQCQMYCWAASTETVLRTLGADSYYPSGIPVNQDNLATITYGPYVSCPGGSLKVMADLLTGYFATADNKTLLAVQGYYLPLAPDGSLTLSQVQFLINTLKQGHPFIVAQSFPQSPVGHAMVCTGLEWEEDATGTPTRVIRGWVHDPWPAEWGTGTITTEINSSSPGWVSGIVATTVTPQDAPPPPPSRGGFVPRRAIEVK